MKGAAVCIGCDSYDHLEVLKGAEQDAANLFSILTDSKLYDKKLSRLVLSPTLAEVRSVLNDVFSGLPMDVVTFFFAGHGAVKVDSFYLCTKDARPDLLSTSAMPIGLLLNVIAETQPRQVNIIIDACNSAGAMFDLQALLKPDVVGRAGTSSISFFAASASDQYASGTTAGGVATTALLRYLRGDRKIQSSSPYLDLVLVGQHASRDVAGSAADQIPVVWGLNLYGDGVLVENPHFVSSSDSEPFVVDGISPTTATGLRIRERSEALWEEYRLVLKDPNPRRLSSLLTAIRSDIGQEYPIFLEGYCSALAARAAGSKDLLAAYDVFATCAVSLLGGLEQETERRCCARLLEKCAQLHRGMTADMLKRLESEWSALLSDDSALGDLHYLPPRVLRTLAWLILGQAISEYAGSGEGVSTQVSLLLDRMLAVYGGCLSAVCEEQAPWLYIFSVLGNRLGHREAVRLVLSKVFAGASAVGGRLLRRGATGEQAFRYTLFRSGMTIRLPFEVVANPSELLFVLLLLGQRNNFADDWNPILECFDGRALNAYIPEDYRSFGHQVIEDGRNYTYVMGHGVWTLDDLGAEYAGKIAPHAREAAMSLTPMGRLVVGLSAYLFPDRVPYAVDLDQDPV